MTQTVNDDSAGRSSSTAVLIATSLTLFSMFFGAGNLIFPPIMGASAGTNLAPAMIGFLIGGVALPVISIITIALSGTDMRDLVSRAGKSFGIVFSVMVYLSIGAFLRPPAYGSCVFLDCRRTSHRHEVLDRVDHLQLCFLRHRVLSVLESR